MKKRLQSFLQSLLGFERYLVLFSRFKIFTLRFDRKEGDFLHFLTLLPEDGTVLDIGANLGIMTVPLARRCHKGHVYAFEPVPENFRALSKVCAASRLANVTLLNLALGEKAGTLKMIMPVHENVRMQGLSHVVQETDAPEAGETYEVKVVMLDSVDIRRPVKGIKIDVENFEASVFRGGIGLLTRDRPVVYCELWDNANREACFEIFRSLGGYRICVLEGGTLVDFNPRLHKKQNFFFLPDQVG